MAQYDNTNRGVLFKNDDRETDDHPHYNGSINVGGDEYWLSAWIKESKSGKKFMSLSVRKKQEQIKAAQKPAPHDDLDSDIPF